MNAEDAMSVNYPLVLFDYITSNLVNMRRATIICFSGSICFGPGDSSVVARDALPSLDININI
jgi:hypothetical protein